MNGSLSAKGYAAETKDPNAYTVDLVVYGGVIRSLYLFAFARSR